TVKSKKGEYLSKNVILATGVVDVEPKLPNVRYAVKKGLIRHCLICDGYEVKGQRVAIIGNWKKALREAILLTTYSNDITIFVNDSVPNLNRTDGAKLAAAGIKIISSPINKVHLVENRINGFKVANNDYIFDTIYSALGAEVRSDLALDLGVLCDKKSKCLKVDIHQETNIKGFYAVGDIVSGLNQMSVAAGQAAIAAVAIFNKLKK
ncbi:MAG TPA: NAD(P)/FAD-dependent oxidoreductase, partial [Gammaproteobacteria bacterium]|nr:NAD(P)/FAD-dependent oxidoreductase [Gammaproteobacteria bacterium]